jgi:hypothetical protein
MKSLAASSEHSDNRCGLPHDVPALAYIQLTKGPEETAQNTLFVSQQNTLNSSITFQKLKLTPGPHLLTKFNGSVNCLYNTPPLTDLPLQRISRVQSTLSSDLDHLFSDTLTALSSGKLAETDKAKRMADLTECLRTYDALQLWRDAEDVLRRVVFREFVKKVFHKQLSCDFALNCVTHYFVGHLPWRAPSPTFPICPSNTIPNTR